MRHRNRGRKLGRNPKHQRALLRSLASELILTLRDSDHVLYDRDLNPQAPAPPRVPGRIVTTLAKAKEVRPFVERCITIAKRALDPLDAAEVMEPADDRGSDGWRSWRTSDRYGEWNATVAPALATRRRLIRLLGNKEAVDLLIDELAPRFADREGGYTRVVRLAQPRLGDAGPRAILEFVGVRDRAVQKSERPTFDVSDDQPQDEDQAQGEVAEEESPGEGETAGDQATEAAQAEDKDKG